MSRPEGAHLHEIRVGWGHCDPARIAYTANLPAFALEAIDAWWEARWGAGWFQMEIDRGIGTPFVSMSLDFRSPVTPRHRLMCHVWPVRLGRSSVTFAVEGEQDGTLCFEGRFTSVFVTPGGPLAAREPPGEVRALLERHIGEGA